MTKDADYSIKVPQKESILNNSFNSDLIDNLIEEMTPADKYSFLIQTYSTKILESSGGNSNKKDFLSNIVQNRDGKNLGLLNQINSLYKEMIMSSIKPIQKSTQCMIDATVTFCDCGKLGNAIQLAKAGGGLTVFGSGIKLLSPPIIQAKYSNFVKETMPIDSREVEILYAGVATGVALVYASLQVSSWFHEDFNALVSLSTASISGALLYDFILRKAAAIKLTVSGFDRLFLKDNERQAHVDGAALMTGYLMGLPCFCFQPDIAEAIKMLNDDSNSLYAYKQSTHINMIIDNNKAGYPDSESAKEFSPGDLLKNFFSTEAGRTPLPSVSSLETLSLVPANGINLNMERLGDELTDGDVAMRAEESMSSLARVLVWLMAPAAAESLKYGKTIMSDPRRGERLLTVIQNFKESPISISANATSLARFEDALRTVSSYTTTIPLEAEDKKVLLNWAYSEALTLIRQYSDLLEQVRAYLTTGVATVGECSLFIENELAA